MYTSLPKLLAFFLTAQAFSEASPAPASGLLPLPHIPLVDALLALGASPPPPILQTQVKSPECASINQGELMCCRGTVAGDLQPVVFLAALYNFSLNPNDVNGLDCKWTSRKGSGIQLTVVILGDRNITACPGVKVCCQVTGLVSG